MKPLAIRILWLVYFLCLIPSGVAIFYRVQLDHKFTSVALVADYVRLMELAQTENAPIDDVLKRVHDEAGITRLALLEDTPEFLSQRGLCTIVQGVGWPGWKTPKERAIIKKNQGREPVVASPPDTNWPLMMGLRQDMTHLVFTNPVVFKRVASVAMDRYPGLVDVTDQGDQGGIVSLAGEPEIILEWGMGFDPDLVAKLRGEGFELYPRLKDYAGYSKETVEKVLGETAVEFPDGWIIFDGDSAVGAHGQIDVTIQALKNLELVGLVKWPTESELPDQLQEWKGGVGWVEFAAQEGAHSIAYSLPLSTAKVHSIEDEEMEVISPDLAIARYLRAVRERAVRIIYLKPFLLATDNENRIDKSVKMFGDVRKSLEEKGFRIGEPSRVAEPTRESIVTLPDNSRGIGSSWLTNSHAHRMEMQMNVYRASHFCAILTLSIGFLLLLSTLYRRLSIPVSIVLFLIVVLAPYFLGSFGTKALTLGLSLVAPILAITWLVRRYEGIIEGTTKTKVSNTLTAIGMWAGAFAITLAGALQIHAVLINERTLLEIDSFSGVKIALYLPILIALLLGVQLILPPEKRSLGGAVGWLLGMPVRIWHVLIGIVALIMLFLMIDRSGNFPVVHVAGWERSARGWFETILYARPRTKEAFVGHPGMLIGLILGMSAMKIRRPLMFAGLVIGSIALTSLTNTFCHVHTPFELSLYRTIAGAVIGGVIGIVGGVVVMWVYGLVGKWMKKTEQ